MDVAGLPIAVQIGGLPRHGAPPLRQVGLVFLMEDACHGHHQVGIIVGVGVGLVEEVRLEELIVEVDNDRNVVIVRADVPRGAHIGKWPNRLRASMEDNSLKPPYGGRQRVAGGGLGWRRGAVEGGPSFWAVGVASGHRRWPWRRQ
jgi:hypothetical protein